MLDTYEQILDRIEKQKEALRIKEPDEIKTIDLNKELRQLSKDIKNENLLTRDRSKLNNKIKNIQKELKELIDSERKISKDKIKEYIKLSYDDLKEHEDKMADVRQRIDMFKQNTDDNIK